MADVNSETGRVGKRGVMVMPAKLRHRYELEEGSFFIAEARPEGIMIRPAKTVINDAPLAEEGKLTASIQELRELGKQMNLGKFDWEEWKTYRDEGRH